MLAQKIVIRKATLKDIDKLSQICGRTFTEAYRGKGKNRPDEMVDSYVNEKFTPRVLTKELNEPSIVICVAEFDESIVGYFKLIREKPPGFVKNRNLMHLERIYVLKKFQRKGIGENLLKKAEETVLTNHSDGIWLGVWDENRDAIAFYIRQGFLKVGSHDWKFKYKGRHYVDTDDVMVKVLTPS